MSLIWKKEPTKRIINEIVFGTSFGFFFSTFYSFERVVGKNSVWEMHNKRENGLGCEDVTSPCVECLCLMCISFSTH